MSHLIDGWILLIVGCTALGVLSLLCAVAAMILTRREAARRDKLVAVSQVSRDWQPTGRINAVTDAWVMENEKDDIPSNFVLRIEENRLVRDIGGGDMMEIRWRPPTKAEVREIVRQYHAAGNEAKAPLDVIEFQRRLHAGASNRFFADRTGELHHERLPGIAPTLVPGRGQDAGEPHSRS
jgi:hypothetical protein